MHKRVAPWSDVCTLLSGNLIGGFGAVFDLRKVMNMTLACSDAWNPVLVIGTDGVGTKMEVGVRSRYIYFQIATITNDYTTIRQDLVAKCSLSRRPTARLPRLPCHGQTERVACGHRHRQHSACMSRRRLCADWSVLCNVDSITVQHSYTGGETAEMPVFYGVDQ